MSKQPACARGLRGEAKSGTRRSGYVLYVGLMTGRLIATDSFGDDQVQT